MSINYTVQQGDCVGSIAYENGFYWETLWNHPSNSELKSKRKDPNVLMDGDLVHIPDLTPKQEAGATAKRHTFKWKGVPSKLNVRFAFDGKPRANIPYTLDVDGSVREGKTDGDGWVRSTLQPNAVLAKITLKPVNKEAEEYVLNLGHLSPVETISGQKARLKNLGFFAGQVSSENSPDYVQAIKGFQKASGLNDTGTADAATQDKLKQMHRS